MLQASRSAPSPIHNDSSFTAGLSQPIDPAAIPVVSHADAPSPASPWILDSAPSPSTGPSRPNVIPSLLNPLSSVPMWASDSMLPLVPIVAQTYTDSPRLSGSPSSPVTLESSNDQPDTPSRTGAQKTTRQLLHEFVDRRVALTWVMNLFPCKV